MGYSREQILRMFDNSRRVINTQIARADRDKEIEAQNDYMERQEDMARINLALTGLKVASNIRESIIQRKLDQTYNDPIFGEKGVVMPKKFEMKEGFHPFSPTQKTKGYKAFEQQEILDKIGKSEHLDDSKDLVGWINPETGEQGTGAEYDALVAKSGEEAAKQEVEDQVSEEADKIWEETTTDLSEDEIYKQMRERDADVEASKRAAGRELEELSEAEDLEASSMKASEERQKALELRKAEDIDASAMKTSEERQKTLERNVLHQEKIEAAPTKLPESDQETFYDPKLPGAGKLSLEVARKGLGDERAASIKQFTDETGLEYTPEMFEKWQNYELPSDLTGDIASTDVETMEDVIDLETTKEDVEIPDAKETPIVPQTEKEKALEVLKPGIDATKADVEIPDADVEIPDVDVSGVEIPDAKASILKTGGKTIGALQDFAGTKKQIEVLTGEGTKEEKIIAGTQLTSTGLKTGGKIAEKVAVKAAEETGEKLAEKGVGKALGAVGKGLTAGLGIYTGLKTAFSKDASDVEKGGGALQAIGSGLAMTGIGAPIGMLVGGVGTLMSMFGGKKRKKRKSVAPKLDFGAYYQRRR